MSRGAHSACVIGESLSDGVELNLWSTGLASIQKRLILNLTKRSLRRMESASSKRRRCSGTGFVRSGISNHDDRYLLLGRTDGCRPLQLVAVALGKKRLRIITGWPL